MSERRAPLVSVVMPAYNAQRWIGAAIRSVLAQEAVRLELIVVDDGSSDHTADIAQAFAAPHVHVVRQDNRGASAARNRGLALARGDYIQWLDADDMLAPGKIAAQLARARGLGRRDLLSGAFGEFHLVVERARFEPTALWGDHAPVEFLLQKFAGNLWMNPAVWLVSRELTRRAGPWDERLSLDDDGEYFARVIAASRAVHFVPEARVFYRRATTGSLSRGVSERAAQSLVRSLCASVATLRGLEDSPRARAACLHLLQCWIDRGDCLHPDRPMLLGELQALARELGGSVRPPAPGWKYAPIVRLFGWGAVRRAKSLMAGLRLSAGVERERLSRHRARGGAA